MTAEAKPLTADQRRAAVLLAQGRMQYEVAEEIGVNPRTISRWTANESFRSIIKEHRESLVPGSKSAVAVLETALDATRKNGDPDWDIRVRAASALLKSPVADDPAKEKAARVERIYVGEDAA
jgi:hypothetical protein